MNIADRMMLTGIGVVMAAFGLALWSLGGKRPHTQWLERLAQKKLGARGRIVLIVVMLMGLLIILSLAAQTFSRRPGLE